MPKSHGECREHSNEDLPNQELVQNDNCASKKESASTEQRSEEQALWFVVDFHICVQRAIASFEVLVGNITFIPFQKEIAPDHEADNTNEG